MTTTRRMLRAVVSLDRTQLQVARGARYALGVGVPLLVGVATGRLVEGVAVSGGAVLVGLTDSGAPYRRRVGAMLVASAGVAASTFVGELIGGHDVLTVVALAAWSFAAGMCIAAGIATYLVALMAPLAMVAAVSLPADAADALARAALVFTGGLVEIALVLVVWRAHPDLPERTAVARVYRALGAWVRSDATVDDRAAVFVALERARAVLAADDEPWPAGTLPGLVELADRALDELIVLRDAGSRPVAVADALAAVADALERPRRAAPRERPPDGALPDPVREALELSAAHAGAPAPAPRSLGAGLGRVRAAVRANLTPRSGAFRHAVRLAVTVAVAQGLTRALDLPHGYWVPLTVLWLLRPDFGATFTRGLQRYAGTTIGAVLATLLVAAVHPGPYALAALAMVLAAGIFAFLQANYALTAICTTTWVVLVSALAGIPELRAAADRLLDTGIGAALTLGFYFAWPTWERGTVPATVADVIDDDRRYAAAVLACWRDRGAADADAMRRARTESRVTRTNAEAAFRRSLNEPMSSPQGLDPAVIREVLAAMRRFSGGPIALDAELGGSPGDDPGSSGGPPGRALADALDAALVELAAAARARRAPGALPPLRDVNRTLAAALGAGAPLVRAADRMVDGIDDVAGALDRGAAAPALTPIPAP